LPGQTAGFHARRTLLGRIAAGGRDRLSDTDFTNFAGIDARLDLSAGLAPLRIVERRQGAARLAARVQRAEPDRGRRAGDRAAAEAITAVRRERTANPETRRGLRVERLGAVHARARDARVRVVDALVALGRIVRRDLELVAFVAPVAIVVA